MTAQSLLYDSKSVSRPSLPSPDFSITGFQTKSKEIKGTSGTLRAAEKDERS